MWWIGGGDNVDDAIGDVSSESGELRSGTDWTPLGSNSTSAGSCG